MLTSESESENDSEEVITKLKKFPYPECWKNNERMDRLFAPFRPKSLNPESYEIKLAFWKDTIQRYCQWNGSPNFCKSELEKAFFRKGRYPLVFDMVINDLIVNREVRRRNEFVYDPLDSWTGWAVNSFVKKPIMWGVQRIVSKPNSEEVFTHLTVADEMAERLKQLLSEHSGKVIRFNTLKSLMEKERLILNEDGLFLTLHILDFQKLVFVEYEYVSNKKLPRFIKIPKFGENVSPIQKADLAFLELEDSHSKIVNQLAEIEEEIRQNDSKVREMVKNGKKQLAKTYLRKRHLCEKKYDILNKSLQNIEASLMSVEQVQTNKEVIGAYKIAADAMKTNQPNINEVENVMNNLQDTMDDHRDIGEILSKSIVQSAGDEEEVEESLEKELADLMNEEDDVVKENDKMEHVKDQGRKEEMTDSDLIALLEGLEVEKASPIKGTESDRDQFVAKNNLSN